MNFTGHIRNNKDNKYVSFEILQRSAPYSRDNPYVCEIKKGMDIVKSAPNIFYNISRGKLNNKYVTTDEINTLLRIEKINKILNTLYE